MSTNSTRRTGPTESSYYIDRAPADERAWRADFATMHAWQAAYNAALSGQVDVTDALIRQRRSALAIDDYYSHHADESVRNGWTYLTAAVNEWTTRPDVMAAIYEPIECTQTGRWKTLATASQWCSQQQARALTGHGDWTPANFVNSTTPTTVLQEVSR